MALQQGTLSFPEGREVSGLAGECRRAFHELLRVLPAQLRALQSTFSEADVEDEFEKLRIWANNVGVFAPDEASLDYRLREAPAVRQTITRLLESLSLHLNESTRLAREGRTQDDAEINSDSSSSHSSDSSTEADRESGESRLTYEVNSHLKHISGLLDDLIKISVAIRKSGIRSRALRATSYVHYEDGVNKTEQFEDYLHKLLRVRFSIQGWLEERLCKAISLRRRRFEYQRHHKRGLSYGFDASEELRREQQQLLMAQGSSGSLDQADASTSSVTTKFPKRTARFHDHGSLVVPSTKASDYDANATKVTSLSSRPPISTVSSATFARLNEIPDPPRVSGSGTHFECPYCCLLISRQKSERSAWRRHVITDLHPYICLNEECGTPEQEFETIDEWFEHHRWQHALEWWCDGDEEAHPPEAFHERHLFEEHLETNHRTPFTAPQLQSISKISAMPSPRIFDGCPFCDYRPVPKEIGALQDHGKASEYDQKAMQESDLQMQWKTHIGGELFKLFANFALPDRDDIQEHESNRKSVGSARTSMQGLEDVPIPTGDQSSDEMVTEFDENILETNGDHWLLYRAWKLSQDGPYPGHLNDDKLKSFVTAQGAWDTGTMPGVAETRVNLMSNQAFLALEDQDRDILLLRRGLKPPEYLNSANVLKETGLNAAVKEARDLYQRLAEKLDIDLNRIGQGQIELPDAMPGTGTWIFDMPQYHEWMHAPGSRPFIIMGPPGSGKSVLAKSISNHLRINVGSADQHIVLEYFCQISSTRNSASSIVQYLLLQLLQGRQQLFQHAEVELIELMDGPRELTFTALWKLFVTALSRIGNCQKFCIIDALDRCNNDQEDLIKAIETTLDYGRNEDSQLGSLRFLLTCRTIPYVLRLVSSWNVLGINNVGMDQDIQLYIQQRTRHFTAAVSKSVSDYAKARATRSFLWASLCLDQLDTSHTNEEITRALSMLPMDLWDLYDFTIQQIQPYMLNLAKKALSALLYASETFTVQAFSVAIAHLESYTTQSNLESLLGLQSVNSAKAACGMLIRVMGGKVQLYHETVYDHLLNYTSAFHDLIHQPAICHLGLAESCMLYLLLDDIELPRANENADTKRFPFLEYALRNWHYHLRLSNDSALSRNDLLFKFFRANPVRFRECLRTWNYFQDAFPEREKMSDGIVIHALVLFGLVHLLAVVQLEPLTGPTDISLSEPVKESLVLNASIDSRNFSSGTPMMVAASNGSVEVFQILLDRGADVSATDSLGNTSLHYAVDNLEITTALLKVGAQMNVKNSIGETPLHLASNTNVVNALINNLADVNVAKSDGATPLHLAAANDDEDKAKILINAGADLNHKDHYGEDVWSYAVNFSGTKVLSMLLDSWPNSRTVDQSGAGLLHTAAALGCIEPVKLLLRVYRMDVDSRDMDGRTPLLLAAAEGHEEVVKLFLESNASVECEDDDLYTPLHAATKAGSLQIAKMLLQKGANPDSISKSGKTPLILACTENYSDLAKLLLSAGADVNLTGESNIPLLHQVIYLGYQELVEILVQSGIHLESVYASEYTPLYVAAWRNNAAIVELLLNKGVNVDGASGINETSLHELVRHGQEELVMKFLDRGANPNITNELGVTPFHIAAENRLLLTLNRLKERGAKINARTNFGSTALHFASAKGHLDVAVWLLQNGVDVDTCSNSGYSALHLAARAGHEILLNELIQAGADPRMLSSDRNSPLHLASKRGHLQVVTRLMLQNVDLNVINDSGETALFCALRNNHSEIATRLLDAGADANVATTNAYLPLHEAARFGNIEIVKRLIALGNDPLSHNVRGDPPLLYAIINKHADVIQYILDSTDNKAIEGGGKDSPRPLHAAAQSGSLEVVKLLLAAGADPLELEFPEHQGISTAFRAVQSGKLDVLQHLLEAGADATLPLLYGATPVEKASESGFVEILAYLIAHVVPPNIEEKFSGKPPLILAVINRQIACVEMLIKAGADPTIRDHANLNALDWASLQFKPALDKMSKWMQSHKAFRRHELLVQIHVKQNLQALDRLDPSSSPDVLRRMRRIKYISKLLILLEEFELATLAIYVNSRTEPNRLFTMVPTCKMCEKEIDVVSEDVHFCKTCISVSLCSSCLGKYDEERPSDDRICSGHSFITINEQGWQALEPTSQTGWEKENTLLEKLLNHLREKYGGDEDDQISSIG